MPDKKQDKIPTSKVARASKVFRTSMKVGANYIKHNAQKAVNRNVDENAFDEKNANELFKLMSQLKGSALKIAQMMSMDNGLLPKVYAEKFAQAQNSAMALSGPLVVNTFKKYIGKAPNEIYDSFKVNAVYAASIGQVHEAYKDGKKLAVKLQYPGVAESIHSDINMVKPLFLRFLGIKEKDVREYFEEFEERLTEECDYEKELRHAIQIAKWTEHVPNLIIPKYYKELSAKKILTMEWIDAQPLQQFIDTEKDQRKKNQVGQALLDFLHVSIHQHHEFHADPHPGNFLITKDNKLVVLDFGCVKKIPKDFYIHYFALVKDDVFNDPKKLRICLEHLDMLRKGDSKEVEALFYDTAVKAIRNLSMPMKSDTFYFGDKKFYDQLQSQGEEILNNKEFRKPSAMRGSKHAIYLHRTFFGLYSILYKLNATVNIDRSFIDHIKI
ncbi:MAG: AarF/ABC1/UbiB kinase family protein [Bacteroidota bacterium]|nr:AarF/ABC1/UbiB kinase family protein [Bacteroidota bacterium]